MKVAIVICALLGLSATSALAECAYHRDTTASLPVDPQTTASVAPVAADQQKTIVIIKKDEASSTDDMAVVE